MLDLTRLTGVIQSSSSSEHDEDERSHKCHHGTQTLVSLLLRCFLNRALNAVWLVLCVRRHQCKNLPFHINMSDRVCTLTLNPKLVFLSL